MKILARQTIIRLYYGIEGGIVDNEDDLGGLTARGGMTETKLAQHKNLWEQYGFTGDMCDVPYALYERIMTDDFWNKCYLEDLNEISSELAESIYGWAINSGNSRPIKVLQRHLNVMNNKGARYPNIIADGIMGPKTVNTLKAYLTTCSNRRPLEKLIKSICYGQWSFYLEISETRANEANETFYDGWLNRIDDKITRIL